MGRSVCRSLSVSLPFPCQHHSSKCRLGWPSDGSREHKREGGLPPYRWPFDLHHVIRSILKIPSLSKDSLFASLFPFLIYLLFVNSILPSHWFCFAKVAHALKARSSLRESPVTLLATRLMCYSLCSTCQVHYVGACLMDMESPDQSHLHVRATVRAKLPSRVLHVLRNPRRSIAWN